MTLLIAVTGVPSRHFLQQQSFNGYRYSFVVNSSNSEFGQRPFLGRVET